MFVGAFIYADDVTLLAPTIMTLKAMVNTSTDFAASQNLHFNASKTKCMYGCVSHVGFYARPNNS